MNVKTKQGLKVIEAALLLGILGDGLLRATPWGLNVLLWTGALVVAAVTLLGGKRRRALTGGGHWLLLSAILFAAAFAWRDSTTLNFLAFLGMLVSLALMSWRVRGGPIWLAGVREYALGILVTTVSTFFAGFPLLMNDVQWREVATGGWSRHLKAVLRGVLIAVPLVLLFGGLFMAADATFERIIANLFSDNHDEVLGHILLVFLLMWISGGFLRGMLFGREVKIEEGGSARLIPSPKADGFVAGNIGFNNVLPAAPLPPRAPFALGIVEIGVALGLLNLLFLSFVLLQLSYLFGGAAWVQGSDELTYAQYYRRGFFELVTVVALVLPILLGAHRLLRKGNPAHERIFRVLAGAQVMLLFVIMASAVRRMMLYQSEYGLTELRLYTTAFIVWLALVFVWFVATVLRGQHRQFAFGTLVAGLLVIAMLHIINPDALIVRVNVAHAQAGRGFDEQYAASLSADAVPALMESLPLLDSNDRRVIAFRVLHNPASSRITDWRSWNWARSQSRRVVRERMDALKELAAPPPVYDQTSVPLVLLKEVSVETVDQTKVSASQPKALTPRRKGAKKSLAAHRVKRDYSVRRVRSRRY